MTSKSRVVSASQNKGEGKKGAKGKLSKKSEKSSSSRSSSDDDKDSEKVKLLKVNKNQPKKGKNDSKAEPNQKGAKLKAKNSSDDEEKEESDEKSDWRVEIKKIWKVINEMELKMEEVIKDNKEEIDEMDARLVDSYAMSRKLESTMESNVEASQEEMARLREEFCGQPRDLQPAVVLADDGWKMVVENLRIELMDVKMKLGEALRVQTTPVKQMGHNNNGGWWKGFPEGPHSPIHSPGRDWVKTKWKGNHMWCETHGDGVHTTNMCWKKRRKWKMKKEELEIEWKREHSERNWSKKI